MWARSAVTAAAAAGFAAVLAIGSVPASAEPGWLAPLTTPFTTLLPQRDTAPYSDYMYSIVAPPHGAIHSSGLPQFSDTPILYPQSTPPTRTQVPY